MNLLSCFYAFMTALSVALIMVPFLRRWALDQGTVDVPDERKVHATPTPRLGGVAIFLAFFFAAIIFAPLSHSLRGILAGGLVVFATGIADDLHGLTTRQKFLGQVVGALVAIVVGNLWLHDLGDLLGFGRILLPVWLGMPFTVFAVVGVTNAINLIDGLDGLAGGVAVLALGACGLLALLDGDPLTPLLAAALAGAILGFLKYNFYPARIFMGDTGSLTVGFFIGVLAVQLTQRAGSQVSPMLPVLILALPIFDALWVMTRRVLSKLSPFSPDRGHVHHKFLDLGFEHRFTVMVIYTLSLFWACSALLLRGLPEYLLLLFLTGTAGGFYVLLRHVIIRRAHYPFLSRDTSGALRTSVIFNHYADLVDRILPLLPVLLALYALLGAGFAIVDGIRFWSVALLLCAIGVGLRLSGRAGGEFQLLLAYATACMLAFVVWSHNATLLFGLSAKRCGDLLLIIAELLVGAKLLFQRPGELFLSTADFLALALMTFLAVAAQQPGLFPVNINGPLLRAILLLLAARILASRGPASRRLLVNCSLLLLAVFALAGLR